MRRISKGKDGVTGRREKLKISPVSSIIGFDFEFPVFYFNFSTYFLHLS